jgi:hypothetical protein
VTLRKAVWGSGSVTGTDVGEALRDLDHRQRDTPLQTTVDGIFVYAPPFFLRSKVPPSEVVLVRAQPPKGPGAISTGSIGWEWKSGQGVKINSVVGLTLGGRYRLSFRLVTNG